METFGEKTSTKKPENEDMILPPEDNAVSRFVKEFAQLEYEAQSPKHSFNPEDIGKILNLYPSEEVREIIRRGGHNYYNFIGKVIDHLDERKQGLLWSLGEKHYRALLKVPEDERLELIENTLSATENIRKNNPENDIPQLRSFDRWSLRFLAGSENDKKVIDIATEYLAGFHGKLQFDNRLDQWELEQIFKKNPELSSDKILSSLEKGLASKENFSIAVLLLTDLIGAGEALKKINDLIVENRKGDNQEIVDNLERAQAYLVPVKNKKVFAELESFYREFNIKEHDLNKEMTPKEIPLLKQLIPPRGKVLESGCGTGRLLLALKEAGYDISGYDLLPENVDEVLKENSEADVSVDDWYHTKYPDENFDAVYSLGRNILHEYSLPGQVQLFREAARVLKKGGKFIFDVPDREKGMYAQNIRAYKEAMNREGIRNIREGTVYDSPNGELFSTRYCFSDKDIQNLAQLTGFRFIEVRREELPTGKGDDNLYYVLEKI